MARTEDEDHVAGIDSAVASGYDGSRKVLQRDAVVWSHRKISRIRKLFLEPRTFTFTHTHGA